ncbi:uncharacterized protein LOC119570748 [Penaeus monodon]|uniref:uncharacterized protein LOC119570748 n=1 Tax=Penaeus monodon TaxID=6687 RepID=UPI0018A73762|nr:uncharacterized protein LOC119570748 [Penaeus monodon]
MALYPDSHGNLQHLNTRRDPSRLLISMPGARRIVGIGQAVSAVVGASTRTPWISAPSGTPLASFCSNSPYRISARSLETTSAGCSIRIFGLRLRRGENSPSVTVVLRRTDHRDLTGNFPVIFMPSPTVGASFVG